MASKFKPDSAGIAAVLKGEGNQLAAVMETLARTIAGNVEGQAIEVNHGDPLPVTVNSYVTDRVAASVTLAHPAGLAVQAKHGALTKAAAAAGLEVTERSK